MNDVRFDVAALETPHTNGTNKLARKSRASKPAQPSNDKTSRPRRASLHARQRIAIAVGSVGVFVLVLSLWHCTDALASLTGSPLALAALLAIGIDAGMVACELAHISTDGDTRRWAGRYVLAAVALSVGLNAFASAEHASRWPALAAAVGATIPLLVYMLARVAGHLWRD